MCFSAPASFTAAAVLLGLGTVTMRRARSRRELPYAAIPLLFGVQQLLEGMLWLTFPDRAPLLNVALTHLYSFFSHVLWPIYVPLAALALESVRWRRRVLVAIAVAGALVGLYLLAMLVKLPITARVVGQVGSQLVVALAQRSVCGIQLVLRETQLQRRPSAGASIDGRVDGFLRTIQPRGGRRHAGARGQQQGAGSQHAELCTKSMEIDCIKCHKAHSRRRGDIRLLSSSDAIGATSAVWGSTQHGHRLLPEADDGKGRLGHVPVHRRPREHQG